VLGQTFYHQTIRKYVVLFGTLFNDLNIQKKDSSGNVVSRQKVPIAYGPKQKFLQRIRQDPTLTKKVAIQLPRMGFEMTGLIYDPIRKINTTQQFLNRPSASQGQGTLRKMFAPVPFNFDFQLFLFVDNAEDGTQMLEQILPFFTPEFNVTLNILPEMDIALDVPIMFNSASLEDSYDGEFTARRTMIWTLDFFMKGFLYPDIKSNDKIIKSVKVNFHEMDEVANTGQVLNKIVLEESTPFSQDFLRLETDRHLLKEDSDESVADKDVISRVTVTPEGGKDAVVNADDDVDIATPVIDVFNPAIFDDPES